jgi:hypothetical protein
LRDLDQMQRHRLCRATGQHEAGSLTVGREPSVRAALRRDGVGAENSAYGQSYAQCLREA